MAVVAVGVFVALIVAVTTTPSLALDSSAFEVATDLRAPWLGTAAKIITQLGLIAIVGPALLVAALLLARRRHRIRAAALLAGGALAWVAVWIAKTVVDRPRPPHPLVHTSGASFPSGHATNSVGWLALAIALTVIIPNRAVRVATISVGALLAVLVGLTRIYLRAHYVTDVLAGESLAVATYSLAAIAAIAWQRHRDSGLRVAGAVAGVGRSLTKESAQRGDEREHSVLDDDRRACHS